MSDNPYYAGPPRGYHPTDPRDLVDPEIQADINARGIAQVREVLAECGARTTGTPTTCPHGNRADRTGAGDAYCGDCRRAERPGWRLRELSHEPIPHDDQEPPREKEDR